MPRPGQTRIAKAIGLTLPPDLYEAFMAEAGDAYGAKATLFRKMFVLWMDSKTGDSASLTRQLKVEIKRRQQIEAKLERIRRTLYEEGL